MLVSAVLDPSAFDAKNFNDTYNIHAEDFLRGITQNGLLILDSEKKILHQLYKNIKANQPQYRVSLRIYLEELLKNKKKRFVNWCSLEHAKLDVTNLAYQIKKDSKADGLIVGNDVKKNIPIEECVSLSEYRNSSFEKKRRQYLDQNPAIDTLTEDQVDCLIINAVRYTRWLKFYDPYIGSGNNTSHFRAGIEYILDLWEKNGEFTSDKGDCSVDIFTCNAEKIWDNDPEYQKQYKIEENHKNNKCVNREIIAKLNEKYSYEINLSVKIDSDGIFHARYLETQQAIIRIDRGFDLFKQNGDFRRNFFTLNMAESDHLRECRELPNADFDISKN